MGSADNMGVLQCVREIITNSLDEYAVGYGDKLEIALTPSENRFSIRDYARSVPFGKRQDGSDALEAILFTPERSILIKNMRAFPRARTELHLSVLHFLVNSLRFVVPKTENIQKLP